MHALALYPHVDVVKLMQKLLPHRPYADIRIWKNANMMKRVSAEAPKKQLKPLPQQQPNALKTQRSGDASTLARRPSLQQRPSQHKPSLQLLPSDDLSKDDPWHETAPKSSQNRTQQIQAVQAPSAAQQLPLGTSRAAAGEAQRTAGSRLAAKEPSKAPGMSVRSASLQEPQENLAAARVNKSLQQESQQASGGMLLSTIEESGLKMGVPAASEPSHIGSMDATDPLFEQYDKLLREELQHQVDPAGLDHNPQPESIVMLGKSIQQLPQQAFAKRKSAVQTVLDAPQQTLPDPVPGHQVPPAAPAPTFSVSICHQPLVDMHCCRAERHCWLSCSSHASADADVLVYEQRWHSWVAPWTWHAMSLPCPSACKLGSG